MLIMMIGGGECGDGGGCGEGGEGGDGGGGGGGGGFGGSGGSCDKINRGGCGGGGGGCGGGGGDVNHEHGYKHTRAYSRTFTAIHDRVSYSGSQVSTVQAVRNEGNWIHFDFPSSLFLCSTTVAQLLLGAIGLGLSGLLQIQSVIHSTMSYPTLPITRPTV